MNIIPILQRRDDLATEMRRLGTLLVPQTMTQTFTMKDYQDAVSRETSLLENQRIAKSLGADYTPRSIEDKIQLYKTVLSGQNRLKLERDLETIHARIGALELDMLKTCSPIKLPVFVHQNIMEPDYTKYSTTTLLDEVNELSKEHGATQAHIQHLQKGQDVIQCPQCHGSLRYQKGLLVVADSQPINAEEMLNANRTLQTINTNITKINKTIQALNAEAGAVRSAYEKSQIQERKNLDTFNERCKAIELENQKMSILGHTIKDQIVQCKIEQERITEMISKMEPYVGSNRRILTQNEIDQSHIIIAKLGGIVIMDGPTISSTNIQSYLMYQDLNEKSVMAKTLYENHLETIPIKYRSELVSGMRSYNEKLQTYSYLMSQYEAKQTQQEHTRKRIEENIRICTEKLGIDPGPEIVRITQEWIQGQESMVLSGQANKVLQYHEQITRERNDIMAINEGLGDLNMLRQHAVEMESVILQQIVDSINASIQNVCTTLFDRDISISLNLFKTMKTTKNTKPVINFMIAYQGGSFDNISQLSGGEGDRASLALTLALNRLSACPFLMLDESLAALDLDMKEAAVRTIKESTGNTVIIIMHDGIEGIFDNVINIDEVRRKMSSA